MLAHDAGWRKAVRKPLLGLAEGTLQYLARYHQARLRGEHHIPEGPVMLVGNHGMYGYETPVFFWLLKQATGRYPVGLADKIFFKLPLTREVLPMLGGIEGTRENAEEAFGRGELVVCYPGGAREVFKDRDSRYSLRWEKRLGFARCAAKAGVPVVPFAGYGIDDAFWVTRRRLRLAKEATRYDPPMGLPLPLPAAFKFQLGAPVMPPRAGAPEGELKAFRDKVAHRVRELLVRACHA